MQTFSNKDTFIDLLDFIDNLDITNDDYDIIVNMLKNYDPKLFVKILEEISHHKLKWTDFTRIYDIDYDQLEKSIENQEKIYQQIVLLDQITQERERDLSQLLTTFKERDAAGNVLNSAVQTEKENQIMSLIKSSTGDVRKDFFNTAVLKKIINSNDSDFVDAMLLSVHDYIVPVDYNFIQLSNYDKIFAENNHITEEEMKKIKSLAAFASNYYGDLTIDDTPVA